MPKLLKFLLISLFILLLLTATILASYLLFFGGKQAVFLSNHPDLKWRIDKSKLTSIEVGIRQEEKEQKKVIVFLSPGFEITDYGTGWGEGGVAYYSKWVTFMGKDVLVLYVDINEWDKIPEQSRDRVLSIHAISQIAEKLGVPENKIPDIISPVFNQTQPVLGLVKKL